MFETRRRPKGGLRLGFSSIGLKIVEPLNAKQIGTTSGLPRFVDDARWATRALANVFKAQLGVLTMDLCLVSCKVPTPSEGKLRGVNLAYLLHAGVCGRGFARGY